MFTGIVEELGILRARHGGRIRIEAHRSLEGVEVGDSIAVNGCCLTVVGLGNEEGRTWWEADVVAETLGRTNLGDLTVGDTVNLERPVRLGGPLDGHLVQGHVDGVGTVARAAPDLRIEAPRTLLRHVVEKGSIAVDGVSLTVAGCDSTGFRVAVIPHTAATTTLGRRQVGERVNLEVDIIAKYVERLVGPYRSDTP